MDIPREIYRWGVPAGGALLVLGLWSLHPARPDQEGIRERKLVRLTKSPDDEAAPERRGPDLGPAALPTPQEPSSAISRESVPGRGNVRDAVEASFSDLRLALTRHDRVLGESAYRELKDCGSASLVRAKRFLFDATNSKDFEVAERALGLLSAPPTHGLLRHFRW